MRKQRLWTIATAVVMVASLLGGCGSGQESKSSDTPQEIESTEQTEQNEQEESTGKPYEGVTLTMSVENEGVSAGLEKVIALAEEELGMKVEMETRITGTESDNIVKTQLAAGEMSDMIGYNAGSLLKALNPADYFIDLTNEAFMDQVSDIFKQNVTVDGVAYGVPTAATLGGGILYSKPIYEELGLSVPHTWAEFLDNCEKIKASGKTAMIGTFGDSWTSQVLYLADNYNVLAANPDFPQEFEQGTAKYATTPAGVGSFQKLADVLPYYNEDYLAATYNEGCDMLANAEGAHWAMTTQALASVYEIYGDLANDIGVFGVPGDDAQNHGLTVWMPGAIYGNKKSENIDAVKAFMEFYISSDAVKAYAEGILPEGPYCLNDVELPNNTYRAVIDDMQPYFDENKTVTALEFSTSVKGPNCANICVEVGSGQITAEEAAAAYDEDCKKQALQLGLDWK